MKAERLWLRAGWRGLRQQPLQPLLCVLAIALGLAIVVAVQLSTDSARRSYQQALAVLSASATHRIEHPEGIAETAYAALRRTGGPWQLWPVLQLDVQTVTGERLQLYGVDLVVDRRLQGAMAASEQRDASRMMRAPHVIMHPAMAQQLQLNTDDRLRLQSTSRYITVQVAAQAAVLPQATLLMDIGQAMTLSAVPGRLSYIDVQLETDDQLARLKALLPAGMQLRPMAAVEVPVLGDALYFNLNAMALLALVMGALVVFSTVTLMLHTRQAEFASWRLAGVGARQLLYWLGLELWVLAASAAVLGMLLGIALAHGLLPILVASQAAFQGTGVPTVILTWGDLLRWFGLGVAMAMLAALWPCWRLSRMSPLTLQRPPLERLVFAPVRPGYLLVWLAMALLLLPWLYSGPTSLAGSYAVLVGLVLLCAVVLQPVQRWLARCLSGGFKHRPWLLMVLRDGLRQRFYSTGVLLVLLITLSSSIAINGMTRSFHGAFQQWITQRLGADLYVSGTGLAGLAAGLHEQPEIAAVDRRWRQPVRVQGLPVSLYGGDFIPQAQAGYVFKQGDTSTLWQRLKTEPVALISEPLAQHLKLSVGDRLPVAGVTEALTVAGIYYDYGSYRGQVLVSAQRFAALFPAVQPYSVRLWLAAGVTPAHWAQQPALSAYTVTEASTLLARSEQLFAQTFLITDALQVLLFLVALLAIAANLLAMQLARRRELYQLYALGASRLQRGGLLLGQAVMLAITASLVALPLGELMAWWLTEQVQQVAFGWSIPWHYSASRSLFAVLVAVLATVLAALYPAFAREVSREH